MLYFHFALAWVLALSIAENGNACVCYAGQEPVVDTTIKRLQWATAERKPCDCTKIRLGGLNVLPHDKPYGVAIGDDRRMLSVNPPVVNCNQDGSSPCAIYKTTSNTDVRIPESGNFNSYPVRMNFTVQSSGLLRIRFRDLQRTLYGVVLRASPESSYIYESLRKNGEHVDTVYHGVAFGEASPFWITYESGAFKVGINGRDVPLLHYRDEHVGKSNVVKAATLHSEEHAEWKFYEPCPLQRGSS